MSRERAGSVVAKYCKLVESTVIERGPDGLVDRPDIESKDASKPCRSRRAAFGWFCAHALGVCFVALTVALVAGGALMLRLANGPLSINGVTDRIAAELSARLGSEYRVELGAASIERVGSGLRLAMAGLSVRLRPC